MTSFTESRLDQSCLQKTVWYEAPIAQAAVWEENLQSEVDTNIAMLLISRVHHVVKWTPCTRAKHLLRRS
jgi:hypothetical protein